MRLIATPDSAIDRRDRAIWITLPFDNGWPLGVTISACRTSTISAEARHLDVTSESRSLALAAESRSSAVLGESRTLTPPAESRTAEVGCG